MVGDGWGNVELSRCASVLLMVGGGVTHRSHIGHLQFCFLSPSLPYDACPSPPLQKPDVLRAVLGCLPFRDLQMVLAYVVRQHADAMTRAEEGKHWCHHDPHVACILIYLSNP